MKKTFFVIGVMVLLSACGVRYTNSEISSYDSSTQQNIKNGDIIIGMTESQVRLSWGAPSSVIIDGNNENWIYRGIPDTMTVFFKGGVVYKVISRF